MIYTVTASLKRSLNIKVVFQRWHLQNAWSYIVALLYSLHVEDSKKEIAWGNNQEDDTYMQKADMGKREFISISDAISIP